MAHASMPLPSRLKGLLVAVIGGKLLIWATGSMSIGGLFTTALIAALALGAFGNKRSASMRRGLPWLLYVFGVGSLLFAVSKVEHWQHPWVLTSIAWGSVTLYAARYIQASREVCALYEPFPVAGASPEQERAHN